jgi:uncharacterized protein (TIGR02271 family)
MTTTQRSTVAGVFENRADADRAVDALHKAGFRDDQIGILARDHARTTEGTTTEGRGSHAATGAVAGVAAGAAAGALWALGIVAGILPGIGPVVAGGILASVLSSAVGGAVVAGIAGALIGLGIPEEEARYYEGEFKSGRTIVTVKADGRYDEAWSILHRFGAYNRSTAAAASAQPAACATTGMTGSAAAAAGTRVAAGTAGQTMKLHEEELHAHKQPVQTGEVRVRKEVRTEHQTLDVPVRKEEVVVERHDVPDRPATGADFRPGQEIRIPVTEERVRVEKQPVVKEEVHLGKRQTQETEHVAGTVRKEEVKVEREGDVDVRSKNVKKDKR